MATYYVSDIHLSHKNICKFTDRKLFTTADEHNEWIIDLWNQQIQPGDIVYHLGDLSFARNYNDLLISVSQLNGRIHAIQGNHCNPQYMKRLINDNLIDWTGSYKETSINSTKTCLFHYPIMSWNKQAYGAYHLHGHCHSNLADPKGKMLDVGLDNVYKIWGEHRLLSEQDIIDFMSSQPLYIADNHG